MPDIRSEMPNIRSEMPDIRSEMPDIRSDISDTTGYQILTARTFVSRVTDSNEVSEDSALSNCRITAAVSFLPAVQKNLASLLCSGYTVT